jgi:hypothetical protein
MKKPRKHPAKEDRVSQSIYASEQEAMREALKELVVDRRGEHRREELGWGASPSSSTTT